VYLFFSLGAGRGKGKKVRDSTIHIRRIPKLTTGMAQARDVLGLRPWKNFTRRISDSSEVLKHQFSLFVRNNVIILQSLSTKCGLVGTATCSSTDGTKQGT